MANTIELLSGSPCGSIVRGLEGHDTFLPAPLPQEVDLNRHTVYLLDEASRAVATLAGVGETIPNPRLLINPFLRREALSSSRIEGTVSSLADVLRFEVFEDRDHERTADTREVTNYIWALEEGLKLLPERPLVMGLLNHVHERLLSGVRGRDKRPGEIRQHQVWIQGANDARFTPPAAEYLPALLKDLESFINEDAGIPPLIQCAMLHYQFEAIHPYEDGNGRIGRLLIILFLCSRGVLPTPLLYLSAYLERHRDQYLDHLFNLSVIGRWEPWFEFFLGGVAQEARDALDRYQRLRSLREIYRDKLQKSRPSGNTLRLLDELFASPVMTAPHAAKRLDVSLEGARQILERLVREGILEVDKHHWPHFYVAREIFVTVE